MNRTLTNDSPSFNQTYALFQDLDLAADQLGISDRSRATIGEAFLEYTAGGFTTSPTPVPVLLWSAADAYDQLDALLDAQLAGAGDLLETLRLERTKALLLEARGQ